MTHSQILIIIQQLKTISHFPRGWKSRSARLPASLPCSKTEVNCFLHPRLSGNTYGQKLPKMIPKSDGQFCKRKKEPKKENKNGLIV